MKVDFDLVEKSTQITIEDISVHFPYQPYQTQIEYMKTILKALKNGQNSILESPTGTGKTLSLLCSTLAYLRETQFK